MHLVYDFSGLFIREIFLNACLPVGRWNIASPLTKHFYLVLALIS